MKGREEGRKKRDRRNLYLREEGMILGNAADDPEVEGQGPTLNKPHTPLKRF